jgi:hypothetical protein
MSLILIRCTYPSLSLIFGLITSFYHISSYFIIYLYYHILSYFIICYHILSYIIIYHHILSYRNRIIYSRIYLLWKIIILSRAIHGQIILLISICQRRRLRGLLRPPRNAKRQGAKGACTTPQPEASPSISAPTAWRCQWIRWFYGQFIDILYGQLPSGYLT